MGKLFSLMEEFRITQPYLMAEENYKNKKVSTFKKNDNKPHNPGIVLSFSGKKIKNYPKCYFSVHLQCTAVLDFKNSLVDRKTG